MRSMSSRYACSAPSSVNTCGPRLPATTTVSTSPARMARSASSASARRARSSATPRDGAEPEDLLRRAVFKSRSSLGRSALFREQAGDVRQVADEPAHRPGKLPDERRGRDDLVDSRKSGLLVDVDHLQRAAVLQLR